MKKQLLFVLAVAGLPCAAQAQVSISTTGGATPNASAMLDVSSTTKGLLPPRMTEAQRTAIAAPATGLVVYQTDGAAGLYCNNGTPASVLWQLLAARAQPVYGHYNSAFGQAIPNGATFVTVNLNQVLVASGLTFGPGAGQVVVVNSGLYRVSYSMSLAFQSAGQAGTQVYRNGVAIGRPLYLTALQNIVLPEADEGLYALVAGDVITLRAALFSGNGLQLYGGTFTLVQVQ